MIIAIWIFGILGILSLLSIFWILITHWSEILLINPNSIKAEKLKQKREALIQQRLHRLKTKKTAPLNFLYRKAIFNTKTLFHAGYIKLIRINRFYKQAKRPFVSIVPSNQERIKKLLDEARSLFRDLKWAEAEKRYLEALLIDNRNIEAYKGVGLVYLKQKNLEQAKETFIYLVKTKNADDIVYASLAEIAEQEQDLKTAEEMHIKAIEVRPKLANRHAELAKFYLKQKQYAKAWPSVKRATDLEPKSSKFQILALNCALELKNLDEAKLRYNKLRLLSEDKVKLNKFKEKIEKLKLEKSG